MDFPAFYKLLNGVITKNDVGDIEITSDTYDQYLMNRYLSFYHPALIEVVNKGLNVQNLIPEGDDALMAFKYTKSFFPKLPGKRIDYHKKKVTEKFQNFNISEEDIALLASKKEMSVRELKEILKFA